jgi:beta-xylosidase
VEAPSIVKIGEHYVLFFSSGCFTNPSYTVNYATSRLIAGPYTRAKVPLFATETIGYDLNGPGGMSIYKDGQHLVFHGRHAGGRALYVAVINTANGLVCYPAVNGTDGADMGVVKASSRYLGSLFTGI